MRLRTERRLVWVIGVRFIAAGAGGGSGTEAGREGGGGGSSSAVGDSQGGHAAAYAAHGGCMEEGHALAGVTDVVIWEEIGGAKLGLGI